MGKRSKIAWTDSTWNPVTGCSRVSLGCLNCYALPLAERLKAMGLPSYQNGSRLTIHENLVDLPLKWKSPRTIFVNSMSDLFHEEVPDDFIFQVFDTMHRADWHFYQILTKRSEQLLKLDPRLRWGPHILMGVTVEDSDYLSRIDDLRKTHAVTKFISFEPLLGPIPNLDLEGIHWVIVGGESGKRARPMQPEWALEIRDQCLSAKIPFFFKQMGGRDKEKGGRFLDGIIYEERPEVLSKNENHCHNIHYELRKLC